MKSVFRISTFSKLQFSEDFLICSSRLSKKLKSNISIIDCIKINPHCMSLSNFNTQHQTQKTNDFKIKYKTQKCRFWYEKGFCPFNKFCAFAHNYQQIRDKKAVNFKYKTKLCLNFFKNGSCKYGDRCQYSHKTLEKFKDSQKTRNQSQQSCSSQHSICNEKTTEQSISHQSKHQTRFEVLMGKDLVMFQIMMGSRSLVEHLISSSVGQENKSCFGFQEAEYLTSLGNNQQKKQRMYSL